MISDLCIYCIDKINEIAVSAVGIYVNNLIMLAHKDRRSDINNLKRELCKRFEMSDLREIKSLLGINIQRNYITWTVTLNQTTYINNILKHYRMIDSNPIRTSVDPNIKLTKNDGTPDEDLKHLYQQAVGSLMYLMIGTRPDITYAVSNASKFASNLN